MITISNEVLENVIWITWQQHRRTEEIGRHLGIRIIVITSRFAKWIKYPSLVARTIAIIISERPKVLIVQNPSMVLTLLAALCKPLFGYRLVVDRHTNFYLSRAGTKHPFWVVVRALSRWTVSVTDLTIVTNAFLLRLVESMGGVGVVVPDPIPDDFKEEVTDAESHAEFRSVVFVSTYARDEPIDAVIAAARELINDTKILITGRPSGKWRTDEVRAGLPANVVQTGYLDRGSYKRAIESSSAVMVLTTLEHCLTCGAYEATAVGKPMILSNTTAIRSHFSSGAVYVEPLPESIVHGVRAALENNVRLSKESRALRGALREDWVKIGQRLHWQIRQFAEMT